MSKFKKIIGVICFLISVSIQAENCNNIENIQYAHHNSLVNCSTIILCNKNDDQSTFFPLLIKKIQNIIFYVDAKKLNVKYLKDQKIQSIVIIADINNLKLINGKIKFSIFFLKNKIEIDDILLSKICFSKKNKTIYACLKKTFNLHNIYDKI